MASKLLTEGGLKAILAKNKIKDNGLQKALAAYEKLKDDDHDERLDQLAQIGKLAATFKKSKDVQGVKAVADYLDDVIDAADSEEKSVTKEKAAAAKSDAKAKEKEKEKEKDDDEDDEDEGEDEEAAGDYGDTLLTAFKKLRTLHGEPMKFLLCDARPLPAIMIGKRVGSRQRKQLTEITAGSKKFLRPGTCHFEDGKYIITIDQQVPGLARRVQLSVKNYTGKRFKFSHAGEDTEDEEGTDDAAPPEEETGQQKPGSPQGDAGAAAGGAASPQSTASPQSASSAQGSPTRPGEASAAGAQAGQPAAGKESAAEEKKALEERRSVFKKARAAWVGVKKQAESDLEKVKDGAHMHYMHDAAQDPKVVKGCKDIDAILDNLDDELRDTLDQYASTPISNKAKLHTLSAAATAVLDKYYKYVASDPILKAIDKKEFADVTVHAPIMKALGDLKKALAE